MFENKLPAFYRLLESPPEPEPGHSGSDWVTEPGEWLATGAGLMGIYTWSQSGHSPQHLLSLVQTRTDPALIGRWDSPHELHPEWSSEAGLWLYYITFLTFIQNMTYIWWIPENFRHCCILFSLMINSIPRWFHSKIYKNPMQLIKFRNYICTGPHYVTIVTDVRSPGPPSYGLRSHSDRWRHMGADIMLQLHRLRGSHIHNKQWWHNVHCAQHWWILDRWDNGISVEHFNNHKHYWSSKLSS